MSRKAGVLPLGPAQIQAQNHVDAFKPGKGRSAAAQDGVKAKIRWLPPGLTDDELLNILGDKWKPGNGKVGWFRFKAGHIPKGASKDPVPAWAQLQVKEEDFDELVLFVRTTVWEDAKGTFNHPTLLGPPYVDRAIYKKIPSAKPKKDPKEGTIDEDDEWQKFLISLTQDPDAKKAEADTSAGDPHAAESGPKVQLTPLVAHILENKANKAKEAANAKSRKHTRQDSQGKGKGTATTAEEPKKKSREKSDKPNATVRILKKQAATEAAAEAAKAVAKDIKAGAASTAEGSTGRRRVGAISDILKRDLGLAGPSSRKSRQEARQEAATAAVKSTETETKPKDAKGKSNGSTPAVTSTSAKPADIASAPTAPKAPAEKSSRGGRRRGKDAKATEAKAGGSSEAPAPAPAKPLVILQKKKEDPAPTTSKDTAAMAKAGAAKPAASAAAQTPPMVPKTGNTKGNQGGNSQNSQKKATTSSVSEAGATRAFLKHANPSQGVTEALLKEAMGAFGAVSSVEIDRRKGFAYVEFADHNGLLKALAASPVTVANAAVQVLERKDQTSKKAVAAATPNNTAQPNSAKDNNASSGPSSTASPVPPAVTPADKASAEQQPAKRSRRRGRGKGGNGGAVGNTGGKSADPASSAGPSSSAPANGDAPGAG